MEVECLLTGWWHHCLTSSATGDQSRSLWKWPEIAAATHKQEGQKLETVNRKDSLLGSGRNSSWKQETAPVSHKVSFCEVISGCCSFPALSVTRDDIISQRCSPTASYAPQAQAVSWARDCQHDAFILPLLQEFGRALILVVVAITHYYNFIYNESRILVILGMILLAFVLPQERNDHRLPWLLVLNAELTSFTLFFHLKLKNVTSTFLTGRGKTWEPCAWMWCWNHEGLCLGGVGKWLPVWR